tara:strand:- start:138 stop:938 length:801 start_codon:yes stop_codon:yes gene_type:complete
MQLEKAIKEANKYGENGETWTHHGFNIWLASIDVRSDDGTNPCLPFVRETKDSNGNLTGNMAINWDIINPEDPIKKDGSTKYVPFTSLVVKDGNATQMQHGAALAAIAVNDGSFTQFIHGENKTTAETTITDIKKFLRSYELETNVAAAKLGTLVRDMLKQDIDTTGVLADFATGRQVAAADGLKGQKAQAAAVKQIAADRSVTVKTRGSRNIETANLTEAMSAILAEIQNCENWTEQIAAAIDTANVTAARNLAAVLAQTTEAAA